MLKQILEVITSIQQSTGLDIDIFTAEGERLLSTHNQKDLYPFDMTIERLKNSEGIAWDKVYNITYFLITLKDKELIGVITGANKVSRNYAYMVSKLLESQVKNGQNELNKLDFFKELLSDKLEPYQIQSYKEKYHLKDRAFYVINVLAAAKDIKLILEYLQEILKEPDIVVPMQGGNIAVLKTCDEEDDYQSAGEFAQMVSDNIEQELSKNVYIGVGGIAKDYTELPLMYAQSVSSVRLGRLIDERTKVFSYKDYLLIKLLEELPQDKAEQFIKMSLDEDALSVFKNRELMDTAEQFLNNSLNISETARIMYMHRNTLIYRLDKIEKLMGLNLRKFSDAMIFRTLNILFKLSRGESR
ncbi:MAG TPA: helix-turn-helix domain-containing protein [Clostridia bacterium]